MTMDDVFDVTRHETLQTPGRRRNKWNAVVAPTVTDDETKSYQRGSRWLMPATGQIFTCSDASAGAAIWRPGVTDHGDLLGLTDDDHLLYGIVYNTPNDPGTPPRGEAIWIDEDEDGGSGGAPAVHPHDASEVWYSNPGDLIPVTPLTHYQRPNEDGAFSVASPGSNLYQQIDEPGSSNRGDFVALDAGHYFQVWFPAWTHSPTDHIRRVQVWVDVANPAPTTPGAVYLRRKAEADLSASLISLPQSIDGLVGSGWLTTNPFTGLDWEPDDLVNTGVQVNAGGALNGPQVYQLYIEVEYDASIDVDTALTSIQTELDTHEASPHGGSGGGGSLAGAVTKVGTQTIGSSFQTNRIAYKKVVLATAALITSVYAAFKGNAVNVTGWGVALYADNAGVPGVLLAVGAHDPYSGTLSTYKNATVAWLSRPLNAYVAAGTYWIAVMAHGGAAPTASQLAYVTTGPDYDRASGGYFSDPSLEAATAASRDYSIYADVLAVAVGVGAKTEVTLSADVAMASANVAYDGPSVTPAAGTYDVLAYACVKSANSGVHGYIYLARLLAGASVVDEREQSWWNGDWGYPMTIPLSARVTVDGSTAIKVACLCNRAGAAIVRDPINASSGIHRATLLALTRVS